MVFEGFVFSLASTWADTKSAVETGALAEAGLLIFTAFSIRISCV